MTSHARHSGFARQSLIYCNFHHAQAYCSCRVQMLRAEQPDHDNSIDLFTPTTLKPEMV